MHVGGPCVRAIPRRAWRAITKQKPSAARAIWSVVALTAFPARWWLCVFTRLIPRGDRQLLRGRSLDLPRLNGMVLTPVISMLAASFSTSSSWKAAIVVALMPLIIMLIEVIHSFIQMSAIRFRMLRRRRN